MPTKKELLETAKAEAKRALLTYMPDRDHASILVTTAHGRGLSKRLTVYWIASNGFPYMISKHVAALMGYTLRDGAVITDDSRGAFAHYLSLNLYGNGDWLTVHWLD